jgi:uncharacterized RDD family membrane protein YckC
MTSNDREDAPGSGDPDDATRADWPVTPPPAEPAAGPPPAAPPSAAVPPAGPPPAAPIPAAPIPAAPVQQPYPGYAPAPVGAPAPGMAWAPPPEAYGAPAMGGLEYAGVVPRFVAWLVDVIILGVIGFLISVPAYIVVFGNVDWSQQFNRVGFGGGFNDQAFWIPFLVASLISLAIQLLYYVLLWTSGWQATLGMKLLGLQVANAADGRILSKGQGVRRWLGLGYWLSLLTFIPVLAGFAWLIELIWYLVILFSTGFSPTKQGVHDKLASSVVVQQRGGSGNGLVIGCVVILGFFALLFLGSIVALIFLGSQVSNILDDVSRSV